MQCTIDIDSQELHYQVTGSGPAIIMLHGWGCRASTLDSLARVAAESHTVYSIDFPGFGESPEPPEVWGTDDYTRMVEKFADSLGLERPSLLGHSFGGRVAIIYASRRPVDRLLLVDAAGVKPRRSLRYYYKVYSFKAMKRLMYLALGRERAERRLDRLRAKAGSSDYAGASPRMRAILSRVVNEDLTHLMPAIKAPALLIWGENDTATPLRDAHVMQRLIPDAGLVSYPRCGHYSFLDNPVQTAAVLRSFLTANLDTTSTQA